MPRFIKATEIPMKTRRPHLERYKRQLRDALMDPSLSESRREEIKIKLASIGLPKTYRGNSGATPGTLSTPEPAPTPVEAEPASSGNPDSTPVTESEPAPVESDAAPGETLDDLLALPKSELLTKAADEGVEAFKSWNMTKIAQAILEHRAAAE